MAAPHRPQPGTIYLCEHKLEGSQSTIVRGKPVYLNLPTYIEGLKDIIGLIERDWRYHIFGTVFYKDIYGSEWKTNFCFFLKNERMIEVLAGQTEKPRTMAMSGISTCNQWNEIT